MNSIQLPTLTANRVRLRQLVETDVDALFEIFSNPQVMRYWSTPPYKDRAAALQLFQEIVEGNNRRSMMKWGIALMASDLVIGTATLFNLNLDNQRAELGYAQGRPYWGQGYMKEALETLISHSFQTLKLRRLEADVDPRNEASIKTLERQGFKREGFLRERWNVDGEIQDAYFYGLLEREWSESRFR